MTRETHYIVLQEGGSSLECYASVHNTLKEAQRVVESHERASYDSVIVTVDTREHISIEDMAEYMAEAVRAFRRMQKGIPKV